MVLARPMSRRLVEDEVEDDSRKTNPVVRLMLLVDVLLMSSMAMSRHHRGVSNKSLKMR